MANHGVIERAREELARMAPARQDRIEIGFHVFIRDGGEEVGAVRGVSRDGLVVYVENTGEFTVSRTAVEAVHFEKVILRCEKLSRVLRRAIAHAHDAEVPGL
jgi:hypothetical protein